jgi:hypothetical protein
MSTSSTLSLILLSESDKLRGYENYAAWKTLMEVHGKPKGLHKYWENLVKIPAGYESDTDDDEKEKDKSKETTPTGETPTAARTTSTKETPTTTGTTEATTPAAADKPTPLHSVTPTPLEYELRESVALSSVLINIADLSGSGIDTSGKAHSAWKFLEDQYGRTSDRARNMREAALGDCKMEEGAKVAGEGGHIEKMRTLRKLANDTGANIKNDRFITKLLDSFPPSWDPVITPMYSEKDLSTVIMNLTTHAERLSIREAKSRPENSTAVDTVKALEATVLALQTEMKSFKYNRSGPGGSTNPSKAHLRCSNSNCGKVGHLVEDCFQQGGGKAGQYPHWWKGKRTVASANVATSSTSSGSTSTGTHWALSATVNSDEIERIIRENSSNKHDNSPVPTGIRFVLPGVTITDNIEKLIEENTPVEHKIALAATNAETIGLGSACVADSGCTTYFFKSRESFSIYKPLDKMIGQSSMVGANFRVLGMGTVEIKAIHDNVEHTLEFTNALHGPDVTANLISISRMDLAGWDVVFGKQRARFFMDRKEVFGGVLKDGLYLVSGSIVSKIPTTALTARSLKSPGDISLWHR